MARQIFSRSRGGDRCERFSVSGECVAQLRSVRVSREDHGAGDVDQFGGRFYQSAGTGIAEQQVKRLKNGKFILIPASEQTHGHGTHTFAVIWKQNMAEILAKSAR